MEAPGVKVNLKYCFVQVTRQTAFCKELLTMGDHTSFQISISISFREIPRYGIGGSNILNSATNVFA